MVTEVSTKTAVKVARKLIAPKIAIFLNYKKNSSVNNRNTLRQVRKKKIPAPKMNLVWSRPKEMGRTKSLLQKEETNSRPTKHPEHQIQPK